MTVRPDYQPAIVSALRAFHRGVGVAPLEWVPRIELRRATGLSTKNVRQQLDLAVRNGWAERHPTEDAYRGFTCRRSA